MIKKKLLSLAILVSLLIGFSVPTKVEAARTGETLGPNYKTGEWINGRVHNITGSYATAKGSNTGVIFSQIGYLENYYVAGNRSAPIYLMDQDFVNADDQIKTYEIYFNYDYRTIYTIKLEATNQPGAIDETGDSGAELYLRVYLQKLSGDPSSSTRLYYYNIELK